MTKVWRAIRWPLLLVFVGFSVVYLLTGLIQSVGFFGSTSLRPVLASEKTWTDFKGLIGSRKGAPYSWDGKPPEVQSGMVKFDNRLIRALTYLSKENPTSCGWSGQHEKITLSVKDTVTSSVSSSPDNLRSASTVNRGVGVRITEADEVKCTKVPKNEYCATKVPMVAEEFDHKTIPLVVNTVLSPDKSYDLINCEVVCAVDYYPNPTSPTGTLDGLAKPVVNNSVSSLNPGEFKYEQIASNGKQAGVYKSALIAYELMNIDEAGCEVAEENIGYERVIPITIIMQDWTAKKMGNLFKDFEKYGEEKFPFQFQKSSRLSGISSDYLLDDKGLHFNY